MNVSRAPLASANQRKLRREWVESTNWIRGLLRAQPIEFLGVLDRLESTCTRVCLESWGNKSLAHNCSECQWTADVKTSFSCFTDLITTAIHCNTFRHRDICPVVWRSSKTQKLSPEKR
ncbi:hypothetical protein R3I94_000328 [Phoxinus phoxinus]